VSVAIERLVNLALYLAAAAGPVTRDRVRSEVEGYPDSSDQDAEAFQRMFERDKDALRDAGFSINSDPEGRYWLDSAATFASNIDLSAQESAAVRAVGTALLDDPAFPFAEELRFALAKIATVIDTPDAPSIARIADERPADQGSAVATLNRAASARKVVHFDYTNSTGQHKTHAVEPYGLFVRDGRWYVVGRDSDINEVRVYAVSRMARLTANVSRPKSADFDRPADFDVVRFINLPFQYGNDPFEATVRIEPEIAWRAPSLTAGAGVLRELPDGALEWTIVARDRARLMRWLVEMGPGLSALDPELSQQLSQSLESVAALHSSGGSR